MWVISYDVGTTGLKSCLFKVEKGNPIEMVAGEVASYGIRVLENGGVEQEPSDWWQAMADTTPKLLKKAGIEKEKVSGISFCAQMQALVLVDGQGHAVRPAMSYMDSRAQAQIDKILHRGIKIAGMNASILLHSLRVTGAASASVKDPIWRYRWVADNEPEVFAKVYKWLDAKDYLACRATGEFTMSRDSAYGTFLYDTRPGKDCFDKKLCKKQGVKPEHLPKIIGSTNMVGKMTEKAAAELGLLPGTPVFSGGGDASTIGVGAGAVHPGQAHVYMGTSGWIGNVIEKQKLDIGASIASIVGVNSGLFNVFAELETAGKCFEWAKNTLFGKDTPWSEVNESIKEIPAGSKGVIFTPWIHGNRCPFEDGDARGIYFGINLGTSKETMYHAVLEGVCLHMKWMCERVDKLISVGDTVRFTGGGALTDKTGQILADALGKTIEVPIDPQNSGSLGAAALAGIGLGEVASIQSVTDMIPVSKRFEPIAENVKVYDKLLPVFKGLYKANKKNFKAISEL